MNQIIKAWCEKNGFTMLGEEDESQEFVLINIIPYAMCILLFKSNYRYIVQCSTKNYNKRQKDLIKDLQATLQCGLPMLWGI